MGEPEPQVRSHRVPVEHVENDPRVILMGFMAYQTAITLFFHILHMTATSAGFSTFFFNMMIHDEQVRFLIARG